MWILWGPKSGFIAGHLTPDEFAMRAKAWFTAQGVTKPWVAMQLNAYGNLARAPDYRVACNAKGIKFGGWMTRSGQEGLDFEFTAAEARRACIESNSELFIAEGEIPAISNWQPNPQAQNWPELENALSDLPIDKAVGTSWSPFSKVAVVNGQNAIVPDATKAKALIEGGWHVLPYVYPAEDAGANIEQKTWYARHFTHEQAPNVLAPGVGWYAPQPVLGVYSGEHGSYTIADFPTKNACVGWSAWAAEYVI